MLPAGVPGAIGAAGGASNGIVLPAEDDLLFFGNDETFVTSGSDITAWNDASPAGNNAVAVTNAGSLPQSDTLLGKAAFNGATGYFNVSHATVNVQTYMFVLGMPGGAARAFQWFMDSTGGQEIYKRNSQTQLNFDGTPFGPDISGEEGTPAIVIARTSGGPVIPRLRMVYGSTIFEANMVLFPADGGNAALRINANNPPSTDRGVLQPYSWMAKWGVQLTDSEMVEASEIAQAHFGIGP